MKQRRHETRKDDSRQIRTKFIEIEQFKLSPEMTIHVKARNYACHTENATGEFKGPSEGKFLRSL